MSRAVGTAGAARLEMARWMIETGSDVHQSGDGPLGRAALRGERIPMMELLVSHDACVDREAIEPIRAIRIPHERRVRVEPQLGVVAYGQRSCGRVHEQLVAGAAANPCAPARSATLRLYVP